MESITEGDSTYWRLSLKERYSLTDSMGLPELPILMDKIAIPSCDSVTITIDYYDPETLSNIQVYPVPQIVYDSIGYHEEFYMDSTFYGQDTLYPVNDYEHATGKIRGQNIDHFTSNPFRYNASQNRLIIYSSMHIRLEFWNSSSSVCVNAGPMNNICRSLLLNSTHLPRLAAPIVMDTVTGSDTTLNSIDLADFPDCDYLIIVADTLWNNQWVDSIAEHRAYFNGFNVVICNVESLIALYPFEDPYVAIKYAIDTIYDVAYAPHMADEKLGFVLLLGDANNDYDAYNYLVPASDMITL